MMARVIEVAMEIALPPELLEAVFKRYGFRPAREVAMSTSVGGIGPLLRERIMAQADQGVDVIGVTLLYGSTWIQSWFDWGQLHLEKRDVLPHLSEFLQDTGLDLAVPMFDGLVTKAHVWKVSYGKASVYFLEAPPITSVVYPSEEDAPPKHPHPIAWGDDIRFRQSWLIGRGALALSKALNFQPELIILSETPTFFAHHRLIRDDFQNDSYFAHTRYIFNDHTPMEYAHPVWAPKTLAMLKVDTTSYQPPAGNANNGEVDVTRLLVSVCEGVYGVAAKHGRVMREMPSLKEYTSKIESITNGISVPIWQSPAFTDAAALADKDLLKIKDQKKSELLDWVWRHFGLWHTWKEQVAGKAVVLWTRRITGYKRMDILWSLVKDMHLRKQFIEAEIILLIGGRIHQHDDQAQTTIYNLLDLVSLDPTLKERVVLLDNFNVWMAPRLFWGADATVMLADDGREASATGFMKAQLNGGIVIATDDGAIPESVVFLGKEKTGQTPNGLEVPYQRGLPTPEGFLKALKTLKTILKDPSQRAGMVRAALGTRNQVDINRSTNEILALYQRLLSSQPAPVEQAR